MKRAMPMLLLSLAITIVNAQNNGSISAISTHPKAAEENLYTYHPPKGLLIPEKIIASVAYQNKGYINRNIPLVKNGDTYQFSLKVPDSTEVLIIAINDKKGKTVDNNSGSGYLVYLYDKNGKYYPAAKVTAAGLLGDYAVDDLKLSVTTTQLLKLYEDVYKTNPALKKESSYGDYLVLLFKEKKDEVKPQLLAYAKEMFAARDDENKNLTASYIYRVLKMPDMVKATEENILTIYPAGSTAKNKFMGKLYQEKGLSDDRVRNVMNEYISRFKDSSVEAKDQFYIAIIFNYANQKDLDKLKQYELLVNDSLLLASTYNYVAWELSGAALDNPGTDLEFAKNISKTAVDIVTDKMNTALDDEVKESLVTDWNAYADTYALILYKLKNYDSAFYYQDIIQQRGQDDVSGIERYAAYAEKVKGTEFAKQFIETQLLNGVNSSVMQSQLLSLYRQLNLPEDEYEKIKEKSTALAKQKTDQEIIDLFGTRQAKDFALKNLKNETVSLASLRNKVVVVDFWATWCGPCRGSFPSMQQLVTKYKDDGEVVFLFIDTWENMKPQEMHANAAKFISENNYSFQVLLDENDKVVEDYKIKGIPTKFVIDKKGDIVYADHGDNNLSLVIEAAKE